MLKVANRALSSLMGIGQAGTEGLKVGRCMVVSQLQIALQTEDGLMWKKKYGEGVS